MGTWQALCGSDTSVWWPAKWLCGNLGNHLDSMISPWPTPQYYYEHHPLWLWLSSGRWSYYVAILSRSAPWHHCKPQWSEWRWQTSTFSWSVSRRPLNLQQTSTNNSHLGVSMGVPIGIRIPWHRCDVLNVLINTLLPEIFYLAWVRQTSEFGHKHSDGSPQCHDVGTGRSNPLESEGQNSPDRPRG